MPIMGWFSRKSPSTPPPSKPAPKVVTGFGTPQASIAGSGPSANDPVEIRTKALAAELLDKARNFKAGIFSKAFYSDRMMEWSMQDPGTKVQLFRFVDAFPMLKSPEAIYDHLTDYMGQPGVNMPTSMALAIKAGGLLKGVTASQMGKQITGMASKFIAGTDAASALPGLKQLWNDGIAFSVDLLGEACVSDEEADHYRDKYLDLIRNLPEQVASWPANARLERDHLGPIPRTNVSIKISSLSARCDPIDAEGGIRDLLTRLEPILETARDKGVFVNFDMEQFAFKDMTLDLFFRCCERIKFDAGLAMQAYLKSGVEDAKRVCDWARGKGRIVSVRLVKGAYWDYETIKAEQMGWVCPVWPSKWQTDACFEAMTKVYLDATPRAGASGGGGGGVKLALGSHNARSIGAALAALESRGQPREAIELQMLHGMADQLKFAAEQMGLRVREYVPVGEMIPGMAYLVRRLLENTSNESWLKAGFLDNANVEKLVAAPAPTPGGTVPADLLQIAPERHALSPKADGVGNGRAFFNESFRDFSQGSQHKAFAAAIAKVTVPKVVNDRTPEQAREMVTRAEAAFPAWRDLDHRVRADALIRAAAAMRAQRDALSGVMIKEAGKTWREADADVCEAIDFCEYYARLSAPLFTRQRLGKFIGELDEQWYQPRGVAVVISPWNFPLAICCGMTVAALVTGNTAIVKPAEQTPGIARVMVDILHEAIAAAIGAAGGATAAQTTMAKDVLQFCPAPGETTGASLVRDPRVALIAFTGSMHVGLDILHASAPPTPFAGGVEGAFAPPHHVKRVVCEMGGKNAAIIDMSADLDEAVVGLRYSAFGFQGQKCSACSRIIVVDEAGPSGPAITNFIRRFVEATRSLTIGDPVLPGTDVGPVIDPEAKAKILSSVVKGQREGAKLELSLPVPAGLEARTGRHFVGPTIFSNVRESHSIWREEIFGPVVAIMHAATYEHALDLANASIYKLTGGVFSRKPSHIELAKKQFRVGNLYINRGTTGALVARQPFGGFGMSGIGSKAGGMDYLLQFVEPRACCENTLRRGFAPEL
jgi:RHH-type transcriptional regulator, proline utilization regulon repressor / proline dehydrogenase / delta 1-pyrroline-5-carboxylate dehydrogenase